MANTAVNKKQAILEMIQRMPEDLSEDDVIYALYVHKIVERGLADEAAGRLIPHDEVMRQLDEWLASAGP